MRMTTPELSELRRIMYQQYYDAESIDSVVTGCAASDAEALRYARGILNYQAERDAERRAELDAENAVTGFYY